DCRCTRPTTMFCRVALPLHPTYDCRSTRPVTMFCRVALPLHPTYDCRCTRLTICYPACPWNGHCETLCQENLVPHREIKRQRVVAVCLK
ncbi:MAG TPA: hypothetical protein PKW57_07390, partial [Anaerolineaceae bacterium]|nr:hypothetical protein [Anaerolineaceae bacterium]